MIIEYTNSEVFGEPGPNICWFGLPEEFGFFTSKISEICEGDLVKLSITSSNSIHLFGCQEVIFSVSETGKELVHNCGDGIIKCNLSKNLWKLIQAKFASVDRLDTFQYIEFDDRDDLVEDANWIIECRSDEEKLLKQLATEYAGVENLRKSTKRD